MLWEEIVKKYTKVTKESNNHFLNLYHINACKKKKKLFDYYFASRNDEEHIKHRTHSMKPEGIAIYAVLENNPEKVVLVKQYRYPLNDYIYELPAGLIDANETPKQAAIREMKEETGLIMEVYEGGNPDYRRPFFLAQGMSDESGCMIFGTVTGETTEEYQEDSEDIEVILADKEAVRRILKEERVSVRAAYLLMQFLKTKPEEPFAFLEDNIN